MVGENKRHKIACKKVHFRGLYDYENVKNAWELKRCYQIEKEKT